MPIRFDFDHGHAIISYDVIINDFQKDATHLLVRDPVEKRKSVTGDDTSDNVTRVLETESSEISTVSVKVSK